MEMLTIFLLHPGEGDSSQVTFTEAQQKGSGLLVLQESALHLLTHKAHDVATKQTVQQAILVARPSKSNRLLLLSDGTCWTKYDSATPLKVRKHHEGMFCWQKDVLSIQTFQNTAEH